MSSDVLDAPQTVNLSIEPTLEKAVDIDVSGLLDKVEGKPAEVEVTKKTENAAPSSRDPAADPGEVEIEIDPNDGKAKSEHDAIEELRQQLQAIQERADRTRQDAERERQAREEAERQAQQYQADVIAARMQVLQSNHQTIVASINTEKADGDALERAYANALARNDHATAAKCQRALAKVESRLLQFEDARLQLEDQIKAGPAALQRQFPRPAAAPAAPAQPAGDPVDNYIATRSPRVQKFLKENPREWLSDSTKNAKLMAAHHMALSEGHVEESNSYFDFVKSYMEPPQRAAPAREVKPARKAVPAAPASTTRSASASANGVAETRIRLSAADRAAAAANGVSEAEWARRIFLMRQPNYDGPKFD